MLTDEVSADVRCYLSFPHMSLLNDSNIRREFRARLSLDDANLIWLTYPPLLKIGIALGRDQLTASVGWKKHYRRTNSFIVLWVLKLKA